MTPPLTYIAHDGRRHFHRSHVAIVSLTMGLVAGLIAGIAVRTVKPLQSAAIHQATSWQSGNLTVTARRHEGERHLYFLKNAGPDYLLLASACVVFSETPDGLIENGGKLQDRAFIPGGSAVAVEVIGETAGYVVYDTSHHVRIVLE